MYIKGMRDHHNITLKFIEEELSSLEKTSEDLLNLQELSHKEEMEFLCCRSEIMSLLQLKNKLKTYMLEEYNLCSK